MDIVKVSTAYKYLLDGNMILSMLYIVWRFLIFKEKQMG